MSVEWLDGRRAEDDGRLDLRTLRASTPAIPVAGAWDGMSALLAARAGFQSLYLSGAALSASLALPDLGLLTLDDVWQASRTVVRASQRAVIVDCDTGFGGVLNVMRTVRELEAVGVACVQIEDQELPKKCGHLNDKKLVSDVEMCRKIAAARKAAGRMAICARTDAAAESLDEAIRRARAYVDAGAQIIFVEALSSVDAIRRVRDEVDAPLLANMTEFGRTPDLSLQQWTALGYNLVIFPVSAFRVASRAMERFYGSLMANGDVAEFRPDMMTRAELYDRIGYFAFEELDGQIARSRLPD